MPTKLELLIEAHDRGLKIPAGKRDLFDEALKRGLIEAKEPAPPPVAVDSNIDIGASLPIGEPSLVPRRYRLRSDLCMRLFVPPVP